jgi:hypothetical protein
VKIVDALSAQLNAILSTIASLTGTSLYDLTRSLAQQAYDIIFKPNSEQQAAIASPRSTRELVQISVVLHAMTPLKKL